MRHHENITIRRFAKADLTAFADWVRPQITGASLNMAVITDTHDRTKLSRSFYGPNGYWHLLEQHWLTGELPIDWRVHLGDLVDGSEPAFLTQWRLRNIVSDYAATALPYVITKGNHDDNDKFAERNRRFTGSFHPWVFNEYVFAKMKAQVGAPLVSAHGLSVFDWANIRVITLNTSDVPVRWLGGRKNYDVKKTLAVTAAQVQELIDALQSAGSRDVLIMSHAPVMTRSGKPGLRFNGRQVHEVLRAFNAKLAGQVTFGEHPDFGGQAQFDFSHTKGTIIASLAGHWHTEEDFAVNGIHYCLLNTAALMGRNHGLTTRFNRKWNRLINTPSEYAGYVVSINAATRRLGVFGYGAATPSRVFGY
ncbi:metallophosphoesterase family protein [Lacticaseibacillus parakribbianus]|uniref:metallophosphoesterase family protein n=1 Tax=Lacticaseibacillus parakribbianus TaxID=2970927 RepID=UPI0021CAF537|nr:metallophosphoesterase [Lacticaseibacillus parakribbianus]